MRAHSAAPWTGAPASADAPGSVSISVHARDGTPIATVFGRDADGQLASIEQAEANARLVEASPDLAMLVREVAAPGGIGPLAFPQFRTRCLAALARVDGDAVSAPVLPSWEELRDCVQTLVDWAGISGGWEAKVWRDAEALLDRTRETP